MIFSNFLVNQLFQGLAASVPDPHRDPDPYVFWPPRSAAWSLPSASKKLRKALISTVLWLLYEFSSLKNDKKVPTVPSKSIQNIFCWHLEGHWRKEQDQHPDPDMLVKGTDPRIRVRIRIRTKISRIRNTVCCKIFELVSGFNRYAKLRSHEATFWGGG